MKSYYYKGKIVTDSIKENAIKNIVSDAGNKNKTK